ncbi:MAG: cysteine desulfurase [Planctomycetota bacterium]|nr:MAG: cysteine desulfurase [Planctomycetota bacterium]
MPAARPDAIYMDNHSTTRVDPRVVEAMLPWFTERYGNAASRHHAFGWDAEAAVDAARRSIAGAVGAQAREIVFTSGATESNNLAILGAARAGRGRHVVTCATEHPSVLDCVRALERDGWAVTVLPVDRHGLVDLEQLGAALRPDTALVSVMHANNEVGTIQDVAAIGALCAARGVLYHCDATQSLGKEPVDVRAAHVDLLSASAHKFHGPKGAGFLYVRRGAPRFPLQPLLHGGGHERGLRSGTLNVPGIVGMARALELALDEGARVQARVRALRDRLQQRLTAELDLVAVHGHPQRRLAGNLNVSFACVDAGALIAALDGIAVSTGSACASADLRPSHVLRAMGVPDDLSRSSLRFGLGRFNSAAEVETVADRVVAAVSRLRALSPQYAMRTEPLPSAAFQKP